MKNFLDDLNEQQRQAVEYIDGASLVIAGAGSGKTRVLTYKIAYLLQSGLRPWEIMALTFTNKAANEMKERIAHIVGNDARYLQMGTFHSVFSRILRAEAEVIGYNPNFTIYDESDSRSLCKLLVKQFQLDDKVYKPADVHNRISDAKNKLISATQYAANANIQERDKIARMPEMSRLYAAYESECRKSNAMDFDDLLVNTFLLFRNHEDIRQKYAQKYRFILVDEYQDTNFAQQQIVWQLTKDQPHVCVVGDDAQSIYAFRGANIDNILDFQQLYKGSRLFKLEQNYRSTQIIVKAANSLIQHNNRQIRKEIYSRKEEGDKLQIRLLTSDREEAINVCRDIKQCVKRGEASWHDFAILYRTNSQSRTFEEQMLKDGIHYRVYGGMSFYQRKEIKDVVAYFRLIVNSHDEEAFRRVINYPARGLGDTTVAKLITASQQHEQSLWTIATAPTQYDANINKGTQAKLQKFTSQIAEFAERLATDDAYTLGLDIIKLTGISQDIYSGHNVEDTTRQENLEELVSSLQEFVEGNREEGLPVSLVDYLQEVSLMSDLDSGDDTDDDKVTLMTVHSAKGLEFPIVYVVGMEENIFPSQMSSGSLRELEEERRLLYVAITRAQRRCILTSARSRFRYGSEQYNAPSRFLKDINPAYVDHANGSSDTYRPHRPSSTLFQNSRPVATQFKADPKPKITSQPKTSTLGSKQRLPEQEPQNLKTSEPLTVGDRVEHSRFGQGIVKNIEGAGDNTKATVEFQYAGTKQLLLKFAKLKRL